MPKRVLIGEQHEASAEATALLLRHRGFETLAVHCAGLLRESLASWEPQVAIIDLTMALEAGFAVDKVCCQALMIAVSEWTGEESRRKAVLAGFDLFFGKVQPPTGLATTFVNPFAPKREERVMQRYVPAGSRPSGLRAVLVGEARASPGSGAKRGDASR
jgi:CheY-like chemotaxis protein